MSSYLQQASDPSNKSHTLSKSAFTTIHPTTSKSPISQPSAVGPPVNPNTTGGESGTVIFLLTLTAICFTLYFSYKYWKKQKWRKSTASKLEDYRYSRLSQNEIAVDAMQSSCDDNDQNDVCVLDMDESINDNQDSSNGVPATLHLHMDSQTGKSQSNSESRSLIEDLSDEDLLQ